MFNENSSEKISFNTYQMNFENLESPNLTVLNKTFIFPIIFIDCR